MRSFGADLWQSFKSVQGTLLSVLSLVLAIASFFYAPAAEVRFNWKWVVVAAPLVIAVWATFVDMLVTARRRSYPRLSRVISVYSERRTGADAGEISGFHETCTEGRRLRRVCGASSLGGRRTLTIAGNNFCFDFLGDLG